MWYYDVLPLVNSCHTLYTFMSVSVIYHKLFNIKNPHSKHFTFERIILLVDIYGISVSKLVMDLLPVIQK